MKPPLTPSVLVALERRLEPVIDAERQIFRQKVLAAGFGLATLAAVLVFLLGPASGLTRVTLVTLAAAAFLLVWWGALWWTRVRRMDVRDIARRLEAVHPDMQAVLLTALDQHGENGRLTYLQQRVVSDAVKHAMSHDWRRKLHGSRAGFWDTFATILLVAFLVVVGFALPRLAANRAEQQQMLAEVEKKKEKPQPPAITVEVRPGDVEIERNTRMVVEARFTGGIPAHASVVVTEDAEGKKELARVPMKSTVENHAFGGVIKAVEKDGWYRVEHEGGVSPVYRITTYVHPELVRSDAIITPPAYANQPVREIKNTLTVTAMEGSEIRFRMTVNKPIAQAELYGEDKVSIPLKPSEKDPLILEGTMKPADTQKYRLHLVDAQDRGNKQPPWIKVSVIKDLPPKVDLVFPKRDLAVSPLQEMPLEAKVWDDVGVERTGAVFMIGDVVKEVPLSEGRLAGKKSHELKTLLALEQLKAQPRQLVSYYVWAEDHQPQGGVRRTLSDMFFAEVRHFEDIFRESESPPGEGKSQGNKTDELARGQKEVVNATWRLVRDAASGKTFEKLGSDMGTVKTGQDLVVTQTEEMLAEVEDAEIREALESALKAMKRASDILKTGLEKKDTSALRTALGPEREALEHIGRAQSREHRVMRSQSQQSGGGQGQQNERQLMQLELTQKDKMYEEEKEAGKEEQTAEQQENLQVMNRLKELAKRQEALAEKIKDVEQQLAKAKTEEEKAELNQQLKRLQEEQEELLRDLDELQERMEKPGNQQNMASEREKLDEAREQARQAAENLAQQKADAAANDATRAQEKLAEVRDEFRQRTAKRFAEEMRQLKQQADALEKAQKSLAEALNSSPDAGSSKDPKPGDKKDTTGELKDGLERSKVRRQAEEQKEALTRLLEQMQQLSEQAESSEPLLSNALHDAVRKAHSDGIDDALEDTKKSLNPYSPITDAQSSERKAAQGIEDLKKGIDRAAESVLGSETEALRMARNELDRLIKEMNEAEGGDPEGGEKNTAAGSQPGAKPGEKPEEGAQNPAEGSGNPADPKEQARRMAASRQGQNPGQEQQESPDGSQPGSKLGEGQQPGGSKPGEEKGQGMVAGNQPGQQQGKPGEKPGQGGQQPSPEGQGGQQPGQQPGEGEGQPGQQASNTPAAGQGKPGQQPGQGQQGEQGQGQGQQGQSPGQGQGQGMVAQGGEGQQGSQGQQPGQGEQGQGQGQGQQPGQGQGQGQGQRPGRGQPSVQPGQVAQNGSRQGRGGPQGGPQNGGGSRGGEGGPGGDGGWFFDGASEQDNDNPLTGANFGEWSDRLRQVEEALEDQELKNQASGIIENARQIRLDNRRNDLPPQSDTVRMKVLQPLAELRDRVAEELVRRESANPLAPLDRDPVPQRYRELVRRYYSELGGGK